MENAGSSTTIVEIPAFHHSNTPMPQRVRGWIVWMLMGLAVTMSQPLSAAAERYALEYEGSHPLPSVQIDGRAVVIHTQGLFVTEAHWYVTGRLEKRPKRALFIRFDRQDPARYELLDITPDTLAVMGKRLDHPGGFDDDGEAFWIPVAVSDPDGPTAVIRLQKGPGESLESWNSKIAFRVEDHIGALAWEPRRGWLYGANWDTKKVYIWSPEGQRIREIRRSEWVADAPDWELAIQDWKSARNGVFPGGVLVAGGIDKSSRRDATSSPAVVEWFDPSERTRLARIILPSPPDYKGVVTREGMAFHDGCVYLLPGDLGRGARVLRYRFKYGSDGMME